MFFVDIVYYFNIYLKWYYIAPSFISRVMETMMKTRQITKPKESQVLKDGKLLGKGMINH